MCNDSIGTRCGLCINPSSFLRRGSVAWHQVHCCATLPLPRTWSTKPSSITNLHPDGEQISGPRPKKCRLGKKKRKLVEAHTLAHLRGAHDYSHSHTRTREIEARVAGASILGACIRPLASPQCHRSSCALGSCSQRGCREGYWPQGGC